MFSLEYKCSLAFICWSTLLSLPLNSIAAYIEVRTPYPGEIFNTEDMYLDFSVRDIDQGNDEWSILVTINGGEALRTTQPDVLVKAGDLPKGLHYMTIYLLDKDGRPTGIQDDREFEITVFQPPELIMPLPEGATGIHSHDLPLPVGTADPADYSGQVQRLLEEHQNPSACTTVPFLIWEPWGIVGFGAQLLGLRVALSLGLQTRRVVVGNAEWEDNLVNSELKWRFNLTSSEQGSPWGSRGALRPLSACAGHSSVPDSVRLLPGVDMHDPTVRLPCTAPAGPAREITVGRAACARCGCGAGEEPACGGGPVGGGEPGAHLRPAQRVRPPPPHIPPRQARPEPLLVVSARRWRRRGGRAAARAGAGGTRGGRSRDEGRRRAISDGTAEVRACVGGRDGCGGQVGGGDALPAPADGGAGGVHRGAEGADGVAAARHWHPHAPRRR